MASENVEGALGVELLRAMGDDGDAVVPARKQDVEEPARPRPVGRAPVAVAGLREVLVIELDRRQMTDQHAVGVERALRRARRPRRVDEDRRVLRRGRDGIQGIGHARDDFRVIEHIVGVGAIDRDHPRQLREPLGDGQHALEVLAVGHDDLRAGVA